MFFLRVCKRLLFQRVTDLTVLRVKKPIRLIGLQS